MEKKRNIVKRLNMDRKGLINIVSLMRKAQQSIRKLLLM